MSQQSAQAIRDEHAASSRARRRRREQEKYFQRTPLAQQRQDNVNNAMASGSFFKTRKIFNDSNPGYDMDASGGIRPKTREENIAAAKADGTFNDKVAAYNAAHPERPMDRETGALASMVTVPSYGGGMKSVVDPKSVNQGVTGPPRTAMPQTPAIPQKVTPSPLTMFPPRQAPAAQTTPAATPSPTWGKTAGEIIADIDRTQADVAENMGRASAAFKPRQAPQTAAAPPDTLKGQQQLNPGAQAVIAAGATAKADTAPKAQPTAEPRSAMQKLGDFMFGGAKTAATDALKSADKFMQNRTFVSEDEPKPNRVAAQ